jgi:hypothetical protein
MGGTAAEVGSISHLCAGDAIYMTPTASSPVRVSVSILHDDVLLISCSAMLRQAGS